MPSASAVSSVDNSSMSRRTKTVRKLGWAPDIVHCNDWITSFIPLYLKTTYKNDPLFKNTKAVFTIYNNAFSHKFKASLLDKVKMMDIQR